MATGNRFVILHHSGFGREHWDLCLEHGEALLTWRLWRLPGEPGGFPIPADRIGDHRKAYLEYEGPLSGDRGMVKRVDQGDLQFKEFTADDCVFEAAGTLLNGVYRLNSKGEQWWLEPFKPSADRGAGGRAH